MLYQVKYTECTQNTHAHPCLCCVCDTCGGATPGVTPFGVAWNPLRFKISISCIFLTVS